MVCPKSVRGTFSYDIDRYFPYFSLWDKKKKVSKKICPLESTFIGEDFRMWATFHIKG